MDIAEFISARLDEDERAIGDQDEPGDWCDRASGVHLESGRAWRDIAAKRRILAWHKAECTCTWCDEEGNELPEPDVTGYGCPTLLMLAAIWSDHADYNLNWSTDGT